MPESSATQAVTSHTPDQQADAIGAPGQDPRPRLVRMAAPVATVAGLATATAFLAVVDPNEPGHYPGCPTQTLLGVDCPGCGGLRATHALAHGDVAAAFGHNALFVLLVPVILFMLGNSLVAAWTGRPPKQLPPKWTRAGFITFVTVLVIFTVVRNFPFGSFLASG